MALVFVSYSSKDRPFVIRLAEDLRAAGADVWIDVWRITGREPYWDEIQGGIETVSHVLFVISPDSIDKSSGARKELYHAAGLKPPPSIIPVMARKTPFEELPILISPGQLQIHDFTTLPYEEGLQRVLVALGHAAPVVVPVEGQLPRRKRRLKPWQWGAIGTTVVVFLLIFVAVLAQLDIWSPESPVSTPAGGGTGELLVVVERSGGRDLCLIAADGSNMRNLTDTPANYWFPAWSPDGGQIAVDLIATDGSRAVYVMNADGSDMHRLTYEDGGYPSWSPDGRRIGFSSGRDGNTEIYVMNTDGSDPQNLTQNEAEDYGPPVWSPDGSRIAFSSNRDGDSEIYVMNVDGSDVRQLTYNAFSDGAADWSRDGRQILFRSDRDGNWEIYVMNADGSYPHRLTNRLVSDLDPDWSPDGTLIAFETDSQDIRSVYVMNADGTESRLLISGVAGSINYRQPTWRPALP